MLELLNPEDHDEKYAQWSFPLLPMRFEPKLKVKEEASDQYKTIQSLIKKSDVIYNVGDPDEEGQLLIDEILDFEKVTVPVKRIFIADYNLTAVKKSISNASDNNLHRKDGEIALARSISDQAWGFNLTRAFTLAAKAKGYDSVLSVGRVQTAVVNMVNDRCLAVENHISSYYFDVFGDFKINGVNFPAKYVIEDTDPVDDYGKINDKSFADFIAEKCIDENAIIETAKHSEVNKFSPMPYSLSTLQADCARKFGITSQQTLDALQALYETHKVLTYPRSDSKYLGDSHFKNGKSIINSIIKTNPVFSSFVSDSDSSSKHKCFNDKKFEAHHAIIPTETSCDFSKLSATEQSIYNLVARSFIALFYPPAKYGNSKITIKVADLQFHIETEKQLTNGWKALYSNDKDNPDIDESLESDTALSSLKTGMKGFCTNIEIENKKTSPPKYYVESTLVRDLTRAVIFVKNETLKKAYWKNLKIILKWVA